MKAWYNYSWNEVIRELKTDNKYGLPLEKIEYNREKFGDNKTLNLKRKSFIVLFLKQIIKLYNICGLMLAVMLFYLGFLKQGAFFSAIVLLLIILYSIKNYKNQNILDKLKIITPIKALVIRGGRTSNVNPEELVVGDVVYLEEGDIVPADLRIIECENLKIKESAITGSSDIIEKYATKIEDRELLPSEMKNIAFKSSFVMEGMAKGVVIACGENTEIGNITKELLRGNYERGILEENVFKIMNFLSLFFIGWSVVAILNVVLDIFKLETIIKLTSLAYLTLVPIQIIIIVSLLAYIIKKTMKIKGIYLGGLSSLQMLSSTNVLFINKIGSLTENTMYVRKMYSNGKILSTYSGDIEENKDNIDRMINIGLLCNDGKFDIEGNIKKGNIVEKSIINYAKIHNINKKVLDNEQERIFELPFDIEKKIKTTVNKIEDKYRANSIGAVDKLLNRCTHIMKNGIEMEITSKDIEKIKSADLLLSKESLYVLGIAYRNFNYEPSKNENVESNLVFVGLIGFENPSKIDCDKYIKHCRTLAIKPVIITDDNKITANAFGENIRILNKNDIVLSGVEIDNMEDGELEKFVEKVGVYSRISSKNKFNICRYFKKLGYKVAVTGKRFTDLPSFRSSHVGIACGNECTKITKELGDIFIEDNDFNSILNLIEKSRKLLKSIRNVIMFNLIMSGIEFLTIAFLGMINKVQNINVAQIIFLNFINVVISSIFIYTQHQFVEGNRYEGAEIDKSIFNNFSSTIVVYMISTSICILKIFLIKSAKNLILGQVGLFLMINISCMILSFYFVNIKEVIRNRVSCLILFLNIILSMGFIYCISSNSFNLLYELLWKSKVILVFLIVQSIALSFIKEVDRKK